MIRLSEAALIGVFCFSSLGIAAPKNKEMVIQGSIKKLMSSFDEQINVPGFIDTKAQPNIATIIGPVRAFSSYMISDRVYLRWDGAPAPRVGDYYSIYTPALFVQSKFNTTDFQVVLDKGASNAIPKDFRVAGYFYEPNGELKITEVTPGLVKAIITHAQKQVSLGDQLMLPMPQYDNIQPITGGMQLSASIALGSPPDRIAPTIGSFMYINRGRKDGVQIGRVFEVLEQAELLDSPMISPMESMGEVKVVYTTDNFSTALVTRQFNSIRLGGMLQSKGSNSKEHNKFERYTIDQRRGTLQLGKNNKEQTKQEKISELDLLERRASVMNLSPEERSRLENLNKQDLKKEPGLEDDDVGPSAGTAPNEVPSLPSAPKGQAGGAAAGNAKDNKKTEPKKKKKSGQDEQNLNQLMQF